MTSVDWRWMERVKLAATVSLVAALAPVTLQAQARAASLVGNVRDSSGAPVPLAQLFVSGVRVVADSAGYFVFAALPAGAATLNVRRIGFEPKDVAIELADGRTDSLLLVLTILPQALPGVTTEGNAFARQRLADFYRHRESQMG